MNKPKDRQQWIFDLLKSEPNLSYGEMFAKYSLNFANSKRTFDKDWKTAQEQLKVYQIQLQKEKERVSIAIETEAVKNGLKTKIDRLFTLQKQVEECEKELQENECIETRLVSGKPLNFNRPLLPAEKTALRRTIKELQAEISKIEGDYAPIEQKIDSTVDVDFSKVSTESLKEVISAWRNE